VDEWEIEAWPIRNGWVPTNWSADGKETGGVFHGAAYTYCFRATGPKHISTFGVGFTEALAREDAQRRIQEIVNRG